MKKRIIISTLIFIFALSFVVAQTGTLELNSKVNSFLGLKDAPHSYSGFAGQCVQVNGGATGLIFASCSSGGGGGNNSTFNATYDTWLPNYTAFNQFWYNMSGASSVQNPFSNQNLNITSNGTFYNLTITQDIILNAQSVFNSLANQLNQTLGAVNYFNIKIQNYWNKTQSYNSSQIDANFSNYYLNSNPSNYQNLSTVNATLSFNLPWCYFGYMTGTAGSGGNSFYTLYGSDASAGQGNPRSNTLQPYTFVVTNFTINRVFGNVQHNLTFWQNGINISLCNLTKSGTVQQSCSWTGSVTFNQWDNVSLVQARDNSTTSQTQWSICGFIPVNVTGASISGVFGSFINSTTFFSNASVWQINVSHIEGAGGIPTVVAGAGAGSSPTVAMNPNSHDRGGIVNVTTGLLPSISSTIVRVNFATPYDSTPASVIVDGCDDNSEFLSGVSMVRPSQINSTGFSIKAGTTALSPSTSYGWCYHVDG